MESATLGVIFVGVWLALVLLYCLFKTCGGRLVDIISCGCFSGPCCECFLILYSNASLHPCTRPARRFGRSLEMTQEPADPHGGSGDL